MQENEENLTEVEIDNQGNIARDNQGPLPDLGELIPHNGEQRGSKRPAEGQPDPNGGGKSFFNLHSRWHT